MRVRYVQDSDNDCTAVFLDEHHDHARTQLVCYSLKEQHSSCTKQWADNRPISTLSEYAALHARLVRIYRNSNIEISHLNLSRNETVQ